MEEEHRYWIQIGSAGLAILGSFFLVEHIMVWGGTDPNMGHEWYGVLMVIAAAFIALFSRKKD
jgi:drug/metabolite transporter (DMT)-like permease